MKKLPVDEIICGDATSILQGIPEDSIDFVITSPPYFQQRKYAGGEIGGERYVESYIEALLDVFHEVVRVLRHEGSIVFNIGDKYQNGSLLLVPFRFALKAMEKEKVSIINNVTWVKTNPTPRQFHRRLVSSTEPFFHFVKSRAYNYNIDAFQNDLDNIDLRKSPATLYKKYGSSKIGESYRKLIESSDLTEEQKLRALADLDRVITEVKSGTVSEFRMKIKGIHSPAFGGQSGGRASQMEKNGYTIIRMYGEKLKRDVIISAVEAPRGYRHPAVYPQSIVEQFINLLTSKNGIVLDPFIGSGTTALAAKNLGRHYIGIDINPEYVSMSKERLENLQVSGRDNIEK